MLKMYVIRALNIYEICICNETARGKCKSKMHFYDIYIYARIPLLDVFLGTNGSLEDYVLWFSLITRKTIRI